MRRTRLFLHKEFNPGRWTSEAGGQRIPSAFQRWSCFDRIINAESITSQKKAARKGKRMFKPFSEIVGNSVPFSRQNSQNNFFHETQVSNPTAVFKIQHSNPMQSKDKLNLILLCWGKKIGKYYTLCLLQFNHHITLGQRTLLRENQPVRDMQKSWIWVDVFRAVFAGISWCDEGQHRRQDCMRSHVTQEALTEGPQVICADLGLNFACLVCRNLLMSPVYFIPTFNDQTA